MATMTISAVSRVSGKVTLCVAAAGLALTALVGIRSLGAQEPGAPPQMQSPPPPAAVVKKPTGDAEISVALADGKKFTACFVYARNQTFQPASAGETSLAAGLPAGERIAFTADARVGTGTEAARYVGVAEVILEEGKTAKVKVTLKPVKDIDLFCRECHPSKGQMVKRGQIERDIHVSGKVLEGKYPEQVKAYNATVERLRKEGKPANEPIVIEERIVKVGGKDVKKQFYTCESCHTLHAVTRFRKYARAEYSTKSDLCIGCHY